MNVGDWVVGFLNHVGQDWQTVLGVVVFGGAAAGLVKWARSLGKSE